jgi:hypothetical protein
MKERAISFNREMVLAILNGCKTQTRRVIKVQPSIENPRLSRATSTTGDKKELDKFHGINLIDHDYRVKESEEIYFTCPYGVIGDRLWVKEWHGFVTYDKNDRVKTDVVYLSDDDWVSHELDGGKWIAPRFMPRWASRILLEITDIRVQHLKDISQAEAIAEGSPASSSSIDRVSRELGYADFSRSWYAQLWKSIYGEDSWDENPLVWVVYFKEL